MCPWIYLLFAAFYIIFITLMTYDIYYLGIGRIDIRLGVNFINTLHTRFSHKILAPKISSPKHSFVIFGTKIMYEKCVCKTLMKLTVAVKVAQHVLSRPCASNGKSEIKLKLKGKQVFSELVYFSSQWENILIVCQHLILYCFKLQISLL